MFRYVHHTSTIGIAIMLFGSMGRATSPEGRQNAIELIGSVQLHSAKVSHIHRVESQGGTLLYLEDAARHSLTVIDVTNPSRPTIEREITMKTTPASVEVLAGNTALLADSSPEQEKVTSLSIVSLDNDNGNVKADRRFVNVTAFPKDDQRELVYFTDREGLKVLRSRVPADSDAEREFEKRILYDR